MSMNNLTIDGEFRYIIQWFNEWSELQRDDFIPIMVDYITDAADASTEPAVEPAATTTINMNGLQNEMEQSLNLNDKPMSLFQCRVKLFNQWNRRWPLDFKDKLQLKITELDNKVGERIKESISIKHNGSGSLTNGYVESNDDDVLHYEQCADDMRKGRQQSNQNESKVEEQQLQQQQVENEIMVVTDAVTLNDPMREVLSNETSVDDIELNEDINKSSGGQQLQQVNINEAEEDNDNVAHEHGITEDCSNHLRSTTRPDFDKHDDDHAREPVEQVVQMRNLQINEEDHEEHVTASVQQQQPSHTTSAVPVTVTVNPVVVVAAQAMTTNAEVPLVV